jgi:hypothetical protein
MKMRVQLIGWKYKRCGFFWFGQTRVQAIDNQVVCLKKEKRLKEMQTLYSHNRVAWCELFYKSLLKYETPLVFF